MSMRRAALTLIGAKPYSAYNRPALSGGVLSGGGDDDTALPPLLFAITTGARARRLADLGAEDRHRCARGVT